MSREGAVDIKPIEVGERVWVRVPGSWEFPGTVRGIDEGGPFQRSLLLVAADEDTRAVVPPAKWVDAACVRRLGEG
jgi:hypothetical protein